MDGKPEYLVKWKDYDSGQNSWEPEESFDNNIILNAFKQAAGRRTRITKRSCSSATITELSSNFALSGRKSKRSRTTPTLEQKSDHDVKVPKVGPETGHRPQKSRKLRYIHT